MPNMDRVKTIEEWATKERDWDFLEVISAVVSTVFILYREKHSQSLQRVMEEFVATFPNHILRKRHVANTNIVIFTISLNELIKNIVACLTSIDEFVTWNSRVETCGNVTDFNNFTENVYCRLRSFLIEDWFYETNGEESNSEDTASLRLHALRDLYECGIITKRLYLSLVEKEVGTSFGIQGSSSDDCF